MSQTAFLDAYDAVLKRWDVPVEAIDLPSVYGTTRVHAAGPRDAPAVVLLPGGGANSAVWFDNAAQLARGHRVLAVDTMGQPGRSLHVGKAIRGVDDLMDWLDTVLTGLESGGHALTGPAFDLDTAQRKFSLCGHSYGAWMAVNYALRFPRRIDRIALLDPTRCFAGYRITLLARAIPIFLRPNMRTLMRYLAWETGGAPIDPEWARLYGLGAEFPASKVVVERRPEAERLRTLTMPVLVLLAERSRVHNPRELEANAREILPNARIATLSGVSHHAVPTECAAELNAQLISFL